MADSDETGTVVMEFLRLRAHVNQRLEALESVDELGGSAEFKDGYRRALLELKVQYLLTPDEAAEMARTRAEMFGDWR